MFGDVYKAWDRAGNRLVAVKRLSGRTDDRFVQTALHDLAREAMSLAACRGHPSVVKLVATHADSGRRDGDCFLVTRYAGPLNLHRYLALRFEQERPFTEAEVRDAMRQLLSGAKHVHKAGVLHRDMAPENVVVDRTKKGRMVYRICGFGMSASRVAGKDGVAALASASPYRAPELFLGSEDYNERVDTWGLGCIMAELVAGAGGPFFGKSYAEVFEKVQHVAGTRGMVKWAGLERVAGRDRAARLREKGLATYAGCLREVFPEGVISERGFEVLAGLLDTNPESRLTAEEALQKLWFRRYGFAGRCFAP
ncbi:putative cyclin-dependent kinase F-2 [Setaria italica]|nr:putative cyclin-dependent kinase F-2 [Setaria italica]XP_034604616.1 putative cyclin-dependent kinase F-2 [Setaria viridis]